MTERVCRCEMTIPPAILDGYACGNPDCWRTAEATAAFAVFVEELKRRRGEDIVPAPETRTP